MAGGRAGTAGILVVGIGLASVGQAVGQLVTTGLVVSGVTILVAACLGAALIRAIRRPVTQAARTGPSGAHQTFAETLRELRKPASVVHGVARDFSRHGPRSAAGADRAMARVAEEAQRMEALLTDLPVPGEPAGKWPAEE